MPVGLFLIKQFIDGIPDDVVEAARIDGASDWRIYYAIILPMIKPAIATVADSTFQATWNAEISTMYINGKPEDVCLLPDNPDIHCIGSKCSCRAGHFCCLPLITFLPT